MATIETFHALEEYVQSPAATTYALYHAPRYTMLLEHLSKFVTSDAALLDIGLSPFVDIAAAQFNTQVDTLGLQDDHERHCGAHYQFDLNSSRRTGTWRTLPRTYDVIVFAEVLEHLYTPPDLVLGYLQSLLNPGGVIFIQTPNAVVLHKRLRMLSGKNPYALLVDQPDNPAHFREYTGKELAGYCTQAGLHVLHKEYANYFDYRYPAHTSPDQPMQHRRWLNRLYRLVPGTLRPGLFFIAQKIAQGTA